MKITYWVIPHTNDAQAYNIRAKTKRAALDEAANHWNDYDYNPADVKKVTVEYTDGFDLMMQCMSEAGGCWEPIA